MQFNFVLFVLSAESTKFSSIRKPCTYNSVCDTVLAQKFIVYKSSRTLEYEIFTRTKISAIAVYNFWISLSTTSLIHFKTCEAICIVKILEKDKAKMNFTWSCLAIQHQFDSCWSSMTTRSRKLCIWTAKGKHILFVWRIKFEAVRASLSCLVTLGKR